MDSRDYERILNGMPGLGVYVIREADQGLLYFNQRAAEVSQGARLGVPCKQVWTGSCSCCPLLTIGDRPTNHTVGYNDAYGGVVDITATRTLWEGEIPAFVVAVSPRMDNGGYTYRKILHVDLKKDRCDVLKSGSDSWHLQPEGFFAQMKDFARGGAVFPGDVDRFVSFLDHLAAAPDAAGEPMSLLYRRQIDGDQRWNLMEVMPDDVSGENRFVIICVKDVHNALREGLEREGVNIRNQEIIRSLGEHNSSIYTIDMESGLATPIQVDRRMWEDMAPPALPWTELMRIHIKDRLQEDYQEEFERMFSLEGLRQTQISGRQKSELLCQWSSGSDHFRYISVTAHFNRAQRAKHYAVLAIQDVDDRMRRELDHTKLDMQMAAILKSRYNMMNTVYLDNGQYERVKRASYTAAEVATSGDYTTHVQHTLETSVCPEDREAFLNTLSLEHLRQTAANLIGDYGEEVCRYRQQGEPVHWVQLRVIYTRQRDHVMVNILGQDVTLEKTREDSNLQELEDRAHIISSLSSLFFSTYYIDLTQDTFRAVTQLNRVGDLLGEEVNCTAALQIYANHFIHPEDRAEYLRVMSIENLRQTLRWWKPYTAVEYRKLPDEPTAGLGACTRVRATAVLAQTGPGDLPTMAVYVAQDMSDADTQPGGTAGNNG